MDPYPNIGEVYRGYNVYKASPSIGEDDSGFGADVFAPYWGQATKDLEDTFLSHPSEVNVKNYVNVDDDNDIKTRTIYDSPSWMDFQLKVYDDVDFSLFDTDLYVDQFKDTGYLKVEEVTSWTDSTNNLLNVDEVYETDSVPMGATLASKAFKEFRTGTNYGQTYEREVLIDITRKVY